MKRLFLLISLGILISSFGYAAEEKVVFSSNKDILAGRKAFIALKCVSCHRVLGDTTLPEPVSERGPVLGGLNKEHSIEELAQAIVLPSHSLAPGFTKSKGGKSPMPELSHTMTVRQLIDIVAYLKQSENTTEPWPKEQ